MAKKENVFKTKLIIDLKITEEDLLKDLIQRTEGKKLKIKKPKGFQNN